MARIFTALQLYGKTLFAFWTQSLEPGLVRQRFCGNRSAEATFWALDLYLFHLRNTLPKKKFIEDKYKKTADQRVAETSG